MYEWWKRFWRALLKVLRSHLLLKMTKFDKAAYEKQFTDYFDSAKRLSDFVGMFVRFSFTMFAALYFYEKYQAATGALRFILASTGAIAVLLGTVLAANMSMLILMYASTDVLHVQNRWAKILLLVISVAITVVLLCGVLLLVKDLAEGTASVGKTG
jgi:hypothetical protein